MIFWLVSSKATTIIHGRLRGYRELAINSRVSILNAWPMSAGASTPRQPMPTIGRVLSALYVRRATVRAIGRRRRCVAGWPESAYPAMPAIRQCPPAFRTPFAHRHNVWPAVPGSHVDSGVALAGKLPAVALDGRHGSFVAVTPGGTGDNWASASAAATASARHPHTYRSGYSKLFDNAVGRNALPAADCHRAEATTTNG